MLQIDRNATAALYHPGDKIKGKIKWDFRRKKKNRLELVLLWFTEGVGNTDVGVASVQTLGSLPAQGEREFQFIAPVSPQSFHGQLFRLRWAIEVKSDYNEVDRVELEITPFDAPLKVESEVSAS